jgi:antitoxin component HigA of HigAB toxin-antitoxin module
LTGDAFYGLFSVKVLILNKEKALNIIQIQQLSQRFNVQPQVFLD